MFSTFHYFFFFFKQKTAYEIFTRLEFRRVLFRSRPDQRQPPHPFGMTHGQFGGDPAADAMTDEIESVEPERIEQLEIVKHHVLDAAGVAELVAAGAARMRGHDHPRDLGEARVA